MASEQTNSGLKWSVAFACCFINFMLDGIGRLVGIFFVASLEEFPGVGRKFAALPYSLGTAIRNLTGPLAGLLAKQYGIRNVTLCGAVLSALGIGLCFFATNILWVTVLFGVIFGVGYSFGNILLPVAITEAFEKNQAIATGISFSGGCLGSFCLPSLFYYILEHYGLRGLFLITAGLVLHCIPASLLIRSSRPSESHLSTPNETAQSQKCNMDSYWNTEAGNANSSTSSSGMYDDADTCSVTTVPASQKTVTSVKSMASNKTALSEGEENGNLTKKPSVLRVSVIECTFSYESRFPSVPTELEDLTVQRSAYRSRSVPLGFHDNSAFDFDDIETCEPNPLNSNSSKEKYTEPLSLNGNRINTLENGECISAHETPKSLRTSVKKTLSVSEIDETSIFKKILRSLRIFSDQCFLIVTFALAGYEFVFIAVITLMADFSNDLEISQDDTRWIFMIFSIGDLFGKLCLPWITDKKIMSRNCFAALCYLGMTGTLLGMSISEGFLSLLGCFGAFGAFQSSAMVMYPLLMVQCLQPELHAVAIASSYVLPGVAALAVPPTVGYFRDEVGSYLGLFYILGAVSVISSILCLCLPHVANRVNLKHDTGV